MLKLFAFAAAFRGQNMNKWWSFQHKNPSEMKRSFSHDRGTISNGDESGFSYWGMLRGGAIIPPIQCSSKPNVLNEHPPPNQQRSLFSPKSRNFSIGFVLSAPIVTGEMKLTHRIAIRATWGTIVKLHILRWNETGIQRKDRFSLKILANFDKRGLGYFGEVALRGAETFELKMNYFPK